MIYYSSCKTLLPIHFTFCGRIIMSLSKESVWISLVGYRFDRRISNSADRREDNGRRIDHWIQEKSVLSVNGSANRITQLSPSESLHVTKNVERWFTVSIIFVNPSKFYRVDVIYEHTNNKSVPVMNILLAKKKGEISTPIPCHVFCMPFYFFNLLISLVNIDSLVFFFF